MHGEFFISIETMANNYQSEIDEFNKNFSSFKESRIALYGIGRMTMTLLEGLEGFNIVCLLDKDPANIDREIDGVKVVGIQDVDDIADIIIINTSATYWELIAERLKGVKIPVYYRNGEKAELTSDNDYEDNEYWNTNEEDLNKKIDECEVVAFDFYDTLFMRKTLLPEDVFAIIEKVIRQKYGYDNFVDVRRKAVSKLNNTYSLDELYREIEQSTDWKKSDIDAIKEFELGLEESLLVPREVMIQALRSAITKGKDVYIVSDMYLPFSFFEKALKKQGINLDKAHIRISFDRQKTKKNGDLWQELFDELPCKKILCVGDDIDKDIRKPQSLNENVETFHVASAYQLLKWSSIQTISAQIVSLEADLLMGLVYARMFNNPFSINRSSGKNIIENPKDMGYVVFGPILLEFMKWMSLASKEDGVDELIFMSRDGYFLKPCYEGYIESRGERLNSKYIGISRQLAMIASIDSEESLQEYISVPYSGTAKELLQDRFGITDDISENISLEDIITSINNNNELGSKIWNRVHEIRDNYLKYLEGMDISDNAAIVDIGYYGNNQKYLNKIIKKKLKGYYMVANLDGSNPNVKKQSMKACFQTESDTKAMKSSIYNKLLFIESFLTAPYGMVAEVDSDGNFKCKTGGNNQKNFGTKEEIFKGVQEFIADYNNLYGQVDTGIDTGICDYLYKVYFSKKVDYSDTIKCSFNNDNAFMNRFDNAIFV